MGRDITGQKRAEEALRDSEGRFRDYAETASDWFWEIGPDYNLTQWTGNAFGARPLTRLGTAPWERALDVDAEPEKWRAIRDAMDSRKPFRDFIFLAAGRDGPPMYVKASGKPLFDTNGQFLGYRGTGTDVTAIVHAQEALRESERNLSLILNTIPTHIYVLNTTGLVRYINQAVMDYTGLTLEDVQQEDYRDRVIHPEDLKRVREGRATSLRLGTPFSTEQRVLGKDGQYRWFLVRYKPLLDDQGGIVRWYVAASDIEDRKRAEEALRDLESDLTHMNRVSLMGELAASLSHEITQPIASARNNARAAANFLNKEPLDLREVREALDCVVGDADRAGDIVSGIRDQIKKAPPRKTHFDLNAAINEVIALARSVFIGNGVSVLTRLSGGLSPVDGDRVQLQQVVLNLILNSVEAMGSVERGARELLIRTEQDNIGVLVAVHDSGPGINPEHLKRVFEAFYTTKSSGTGMGLSICRSIIEAHGGRLWAQANQPRGAVLQFTLPGSEAAL